MIFLSPASLFPGTGNDAEPKKVLIGAAPLLDWPHQAHLPCAPALAFNRLEFSRKVAS